MQLTPRGSFFVGWFVGTVVLAFFILNDPFNVRVEQVSTTNQSPPALVEVEANPTPSVKGKHCQQVLVQDGPAWQYNGLAIFQCGNKEIVVSEKVLDEWLESTTRVPNNVANDGRA